MGLVLWSFWVPDFHHLDRSIAFVLTQKLQPPFHQGPGGPSIPRTTFSTPLILRALKLSLELSRVSLERDSLSRELLRAISQKVALTQELEAWQVRESRLYGGLVDRYPDLIPPPYPPCFASYLQDDMQVVIGQQLRSQRQKELSEAAAATRRAKNRFSLRLGSRQSGGFLSNLFRRT